MSDINDGGPAFPGTGIVSWRNCEGGLQNAADNVRIPGMSLRDYFAARASESDLAEPGDVGACKKMLGMKEDEKWVFERDFPRLRAMTRYAYADAMILAREKGANQ